MSFLDLPLPLKFPSSRWFGVDDLFSFASIPIRRPCFPSVGPWPRFEVREILSATPLLLTPPLGRALAGFSPLPAVNSLSPLSPRCVHSGQAPVPLFLLFLSSRPFFGYDGFFPLAVTFSGCCIVFLMRLTNPCSPPGAGLAFPFFLVSSFFCYWRALLRRNCGLFGPCPDE